MSPDWMRRTVVLGLWVALAAVVGAATPAASADVLPPGHTSVEVTARFDWGPLAGRLAHPVAAKAGDTWETLAAREAGDARWAPTVRALNGGGERPAPSGSAWVPPRGVAFGSDVVWYAAFLDCSKFGAGSDVSRTGLDPLDPAATSVAIFGTVTVALVRVSTTDDAARAAALPRERPRDALAAGGERALIVAAPFQVATSVRESSPVRSIRQRWRCTGLEGTTLRLELVSEESRDAKGRVVGTLEAAIPGLRTEWIAGVVAFVLLSVAMLALARRRRRRALAA